EAGADAGRQDHRLVDLAIGGPPRLSGHPAQPGADHCQQRLPPHPPGQDQAVRHEGDLHLLPRRPLLLHVPGPDHDRRPLDVLLRPL
ncbi:MAG: Ubiquinol--cytochrome c reductase, cytochrome B subunit, partial [uncultured Thermomicrobiales bacterium]